MAETVDLGYVKGPTGDTGPVGPTGPQGDPATVPTTDLENFQGYIGFDEAESSTATGNEFAPLSQLKSMFDSIKASIAEREAADQEIKESIAALPTTEALTQAIAAEASTREKADQLLETEVNGKLDAADLVAGSNVSIDTSSEPGKVIVSADVPEQIDDYLPYVTKSNGCFAGITNVGPFSETSDEIPYETVVNIEASNTQAGIGVVDKNNNSALLVVSNNGPDDAVALALLNGKYARIILDGSVESAISIGEVALRYHHAESKAYFCNTEFNASTGVSTQSLAGLMSAADKTKLDGLNNYTIATDAEASGLLGY